MNETIKYIYNTVLILKLVMLATNIAQAAPVSTDYGYYNYPRSPLLRLRIRSHSPKPTQDLLRLVRENMFESEELWRFKNRDAFEKLVRTHIDDPELGQQIEALYSPTISNKDFVASATYFGRMQGDGYVFVPNEMRRILPQSFVQTVFDHQRQELDRVPLHYIERNSLKELVTKIRKIAPKAYWSTLKSSTIKVDGKYILPITPHIWPLLSEPYRLSYLDHLFRKEIARKGLAVNLILEKGDDLREIARTFAGERDENVISAMERYLRIQLGTAETIEVPLQKILQPFIRDNLDRFESCSGPNCFLSAYNVNRSYNPRTEPIPNDSVLLWEVYPKYRFVAQSESLRAGDLLIYLNSEDKVVHASTYVGNGVVFTKNGINRFNPYIFQKMQDNEKLYFSDGKFRLMAFRIPEAGKSPVSATNLYFGRPVIYSHHEDLEFKNIRFNANWDYQRRLNRLEELFTVWMGSSEMDELLRLRDDPRVSDMQAQIQTLISQNLKLQGIIYDLLSIGFLPFREPDKNKKALLKLMNKAFLESSQEIALHWVADNYGNTYRSELQEISAKFRIKLGKMANGTPSCGYYLIGVLPAAL